MLAPETVLQNRYRVIRLLGQGGMGAVYEAIDERLDSTVALKETLFTDERLRKQFEREARLLARMHHPALPRVSDHFAEGDGEFLVMQFIPGEDLSQMTARKQGPFPPDQVLIWGDQLLDALDYLHTQDPQIIHRDIKPQNLKLTGRGQIILLDFGLAKGQTGGVSMVTTSASIFGYTPNYAPLEQIQGLGTDARSDIYALSATLYHLMTGVKPPDALTRAAALVNGQPDPLIPANEINGSVGPEIASVLARAMSQNKEQRYPSAAGMRAALDGTGEAATLLGKTEVPTVIREKPGVTVADAGAQSKPTSKSAAARTGETTIVQTAISQRKSSVAPWAIGAGAVLLIGVLFGAFYAYQHRNNSNAAAAPGSSPSPEQTIEATAQPSPALNQATPEPSAGEPNGIKKIIIAGHPPVEEAPKKAEKPGKKAEKEANPVPVPPTADERFEPVVPIRPETNQPDPTRADRRGVRRLGGGVTTRNFPDGRQVTTLPDGTRVMTNRDGTQQVFRPGVKPLRRNRP